MTTYTLDPGKALLYLYEPEGSTSRWNFGYAVNTPVDNPGGMGLAVQLSYSFLTAPTLEEPTRLFRAFNVVEQMAARQVLQSISEVANITWTEKATAGELRIGMVAMNSATAGYAYMPGFSYSYSDSIGEELFTRVTAMPEAGDTYLNSVTSWTAADFAPSGSGWHTLLHEFGHALGLDHSFEGKFQLTPSHDHQGYTVMSYTTHPNSLVRSVEITSTSYSASYEYLEPETMMPYDIAALQLLYGVNTTTRRGNDVYQFDVDRPFIKTIWDAAGTDTISASNFKLGVVINLTPGSFSSLRMTPEALPDWADPETYTDIYDGTNNLAIAFDCVIENAIGGQGNDKLLGNAANNTLSGGTGNDTINGSTGADSMTGGYGSDTYYVDSTSDKVIETNATASTGGTDLVLSYLSAYTLGTNVENGRIVTTGAASLAGNSLNNVLYAGAGNNVINGGTGTDTLSYAYGVSGTAGVVVSLARTLAQATGGSGSDTLVKIENLTGSAYADKLTGNSGANALSGGAGNDLLTGGLGADKLTGGTGADRFDFNALAEMGLSSSTWDTITDFKTSEGDKIDFLGVDANTALTGNQAFTYLGTAAFTGNATGQLRFDATAHILYGSTDADTAAEFAIVLTGVSSLASADLVL
jgi:Ca2+-binding RTX toxin-like protein